MTQPAAAHRSWNEILGPYKGAHLGHSLFQLLSNAALFALGWWAMLAALDVSYVLTLLLALPTAGIMTRLFIIQHDCGHGSFFRSNLANHSVGSVIGVLLLTPYHYWRRTHAIHHATSGDLDHREFGDIDTLTVREYRALSRWGRLRYRFYRNAFVLLVVAPIYQFVLKHRFPIDAPRAWRKEWASILGTNLALVAVVAGMIRWVGLERFLLVQLPLTLISGALGIFLFYVQHQFNDTYWREHEQWDARDAALQGSSFFDLPPLLHWFTGYIGFHHVHHLASRIPNYRLRRCMREVPELHRVTRLGLLDALRCLRLKLWDEESQQLIGFRDLRALPAA